MRRLWLIFSQAVTVGLAMLFIVATLKPQWLSRRARPLTDVVTLRSAAVLPPLLVGTPASAAAAHSGLSAAARAAAPAVVSVSAGKAGRLPHADSPGPRRPFDGPGDDVHGQTQIGYGSGVIVSADGVLLTNNHVVEGAQHITVRLTDGRESAAEVVGTDPETDLAVLRIPLDRLPTVVLGDLAALQVGDAVLAIGNPFNVGQTVTAGIVSALGRNGLGLSTFESFIQTDAAINPGNSGGALVDAQGRLVGINTAIFSRSGGSLGIGFAIPVDLARSVMESLLRDGQVTRGWIGVEPRELSAEFIENFQLPIRQGVLITGVLQDGPAARGGVRPGDVVLRVADQPVASVAQLLDAVAALRPGSQTRVQVQRGQRRLDLALTVAQRQRPPSAASPTPAD